MKRNGVREVLVKTLHGQICLRLLRLRGETGERTYLDGQSRESVGVREMSAYYANRMSYAEVADLLRRVSGERIVSEPTIREMVVLAASRASAEMETGREELKMPEIAVRVDVYDPGVEETLVFDDAIEVREQAAKRERGRIEPKAHGVKRRVSTDVVVLTRADRTFGYVTATLNADGTRRSSVEANIAAVLGREYGGWTKALNLVAITDGAQSIRRRWERLVGSLTIILDWYHLAKKVRELMSMIGRTKAEKETHIRCLLSALWHGDTSTALTYLNVEVAVRNDAKHQELIGYLDKHRDEIIDYGRRAKIGKPIGSGRGEKAVDQVIGHRQKKKGMSWRTPGSLALGVLKTVELNGKWQKLWGFREIPVC